MNKKLLSISTILILTVVLAGCALSADSDGTKKNGESDEPTSETASYEDTGFAMGTVVNQTIYSSNKNIASKIIDILTETENKWISWRVKDSEIAKINHNAQTGTPTEISDETREYIASALSIVKKSDGAFDPTIGKLTRLWDFDGEKNVIPDHEDIRSLLKSVDYANISLKGNEVEVKNQTSIDLGAIGKGIGNDEIEKYLDSLDDVRGALINTGGSSVLTYGSKDTDKPWKVAVLNPRDDSDYLGAISLDGTWHVSTSGDYEKYFEEDGKRYHHILDPYTGYPADKGLISVTIVGKKGATCDGLSTACFVLGKDKALKLLENYDAEAVFVDSDKNVYVTEGLAENFELLADTDYKLK